MSEDLLYYCGISPFLLFAVLILYLLFKPQGKDDELFAYKGKPELKYIISQLRRFEILHKRNYSEKAIKVLGMFTDRKLTDRELDSLEVILTSAYFDSYRDRWIGFRKAEPLLVFIFFYVFLWSFAAWNLVVFHKDEVSIGALLLVDILLFIVPVVFAMIMFFFLMLPLYFFAVIFPTIGTFPRSIICLEEMIKALNPAGRKSRILTQSISQNSAIVTI